MDGPKPKFEHHDDRPPLEAGYINVTLPTQLPSMALGDLMGHTRRIPTREDRDEVQDIGPRLQQEGGRWQDFPKYRIDFIDEGEPEAIEDPEYEKQYEDPTRATLEPKIKDEP